MQGLFRTSESFEIRSILPYSYFLSFYNYVVIYHTKRNINLVIYSVVYAIVSDCNSVTSAVTEKR